VANNTIDIAEGTPTKKLASQSFTRGVDTVHQEEVVIGDGTTDGRIASVTAANALKVDGSAVTQPVSDGGGALTVDALDLDIRNLIPANDEVQARDKAQFDDVAPSLPAEDAYADLRLTANRGLHVNLRAAAGTEVGTAAAPVRVDPTGTTTQPISAASLPLPAGAATAALQLPDSHNVTVDNAAGAAAVFAQGQAADGVAVAGNPVRIAGKDGGGLTQDIATDAAGELQVDVLSSALPSGAATAAAQLPDSHNVTVDNAAGAAAVNVQDGGNSLTVDGTVTAAQATAASLNAEVQGDAAHDAVASGNPVQTGSVASLDEPTAVADGDAVRFWTDQLGRQVVLQGHSDPEPPVTANGSAAGLSVIAAPGASVSLHICKGSLHNRGVEQVVSLRDGAAGTIRFTANLAADGGGSLFDFGSRGWKLTANTALVADIAAASVDVNVTEYYIAP